MIAEAALEAMTARRASIEVLRRRAEARRRVAAIDDMLEVLELMHLAHDRAIDRSLRLRLRTLEAVVELALPRKVVRARNTVRLHAALLDWQDVVLDEVAPWRRILLAEDGLDEDGLDETA